MPVWRDELLTQLLNCAPVTFVPPTRCYLYRHKYLLSPSIHAIHPDLAYMHTALVLLGCDKNRITISIIIELIRFLRDKDETIKTLSLNIQDKMCAIYTWICEEGNKSSECLANLQKELVNEPWIWNQKYYTFYPESSVTSDMAYLHFNSPFLVPFPFKDMINETNKITLKFLGIKNKVTFKDAISIICTMKSHYNDRELPDYDCNLVIKLINDVIPYTNEKSEQYFLLTETNQLQKSSTIFYNDILWMTDTFSEEDKSKLVHKKITAIASYKTGAGSKRETFYESELFSIEEFGPYEDIKTRIENLLREFPPDISIIKELLQNAEDANATQMAFIIDNKKCYNVDTLCVREDKYPNWKTLQTSPSLLIYNNKSFTAEDLEGIRRVGLGGKQGKKSIGRFGLGFNAVYHITNTPCLLTADTTGEQVTFCVFDPFRKIFNIKHYPGVKISFSQNHRYENFPDQFAPFMNETLLKSFPKTFQNLINKKEFSLFRLPFKSHETKSNLANNLMEDLLRVGSQLIIFLRQLEQIDILEISQDGHEIIYKGSITREDTQVKNDRKNNIVYTILDRKITTSIPPVTTLQMLSTESSESSELQKKLSKRAERENSSKVDRWLIYHCEGELQNFTRTHNIQQFEQHYVEEKLRVFGSLAVCLPSNDEFQNLVKKNISSFLYCFLPFGVKHNYPICVNAPFILDPHRKYVSYQNQETGRDSWDFVWHQKIIEETLSLLYFQLLLDLRDYKYHPDCRESVYFTWYYSLYPALHVSDYSTNSDRFLMSLSKQLYKLLAHANSEILLLDNSKFNIWYSISGPHQGIFKHPSSIELKNIHIDSMYISLIEIGYRLTCAPLKLFYSFSACKFDCQMISQEHLFNYIVSDRNCVCQPGYNFPCLLIHCKLNFIQLKLLLEYLLTLYTGDLESSTKLEEIPLMVDCKDKLGIFTNGKSNTTYTSTYSDLLPHKSTHFINSNYSPTIVSSLIDKQYISELTCEFLSNHLVPHPNPQTDFYLLFWTFIVDCKISSQILLEEFTSQTLVPVIFGEDSSNTTFLKISELTKVATCLIDSTILRILRLLKCPILKLPEPDETTLIQYEMNHSLIEQYLHSIVITRLVATSIISCISLGKNIDFPLQREDAAVLRQLFNSLFNLQHLDFNSIIALSKLKIFLTEEGHLCSLNQFNVCYVNSNKLPVITDNLTQILSATYKLGILSQEHNPAFLLEHMRRQCHIKIVDIFDLLIEYIIPILCTLQVHTAICLLKYSFGLKYEPKFNWGISNEIRENWIDRLTSKLNETPFIYNSHIKAFVRPCDLYTPKIEIFCVYKNHNLIAEEWVRDANSILERLKLKIQPEVSFLLECAKRIEAGEFTNDKHIKLVIDQLSIANYSDCHHSIITQIGQIKFVPMIITSMDSSYFSTERIELGRFSDGQLNQHYSICYTTCWVYRHNINVHNNTIEQLLGIPREPSAGSAITHLKYLICFILTGKLMDDKKRLGNYMIKTYEFLQNFPRERFIDFQDGNKFEKCLICEFDGTLEILRPINLIFEEIHGFNRFLFTVPIQLRHVSCFLKSVGVCKTATHRHYIEVLRSMNELSGDTCITDEQYKLITTLAFECLIRHLRDYELEGSNINLNNCLLLTEQWRLCPYNSPNIIYADDRRLLHQLIKSNQLRHCILTPLHTDSNGSLAPPKCLQLKYISNLYKVTLNEDTYQEANRLNINRTAQQYNAQIHSAEFKKSLIRLYFHETQKLLSDIRFNKKEIIFLPNSVLTANSDNLSIDQKISNLTVLAVNTINLSVTNELGQATTSNDACVCILDEDRNIILIKSDPASASIIQTEITLELDKYFCYLFSKLLIYLQVCLVYPVGKLDDALDSFDIRKSAL